MILKHTGNCLKKQKLLVNNNLIHEDQKNSFSVCCVFPSFFLSFFSISFPFSYLLINVYFCSQSCKININFLLRVAELENINTFVIWWQKSGRFFLIFILFIYSLIDVPLLLFIYLFIYFRIYLFIAFEEQCKKMGKFYKMYYEKISHGKHAEVILSDLTTCYVLRILHSALFIVPGVHDILLGVTYTTDNAPTCYYHDESTVVTKLQTA
jgi:hypothetical protein